jgi:hypothetical protein
MRKDDIGERKKSRKLEKMSERGEKHKGGREGDRPRQ